MIRLALCLFLLAPPAFARDVTVFAAASLKTVLDRLAPMAEAETGLRLRLSFAGSSALARQIELGAPADLFISASDDWMDHLEAKGLVGARQILASNRLALIAHGPAAPAEVGPDLDLETLLGEGRLAVALTAAVPAGIYAKAALEALGLWPALRGRLAETDNVRAALALVAAGAIPLGIVYATDAAAEPKVSLIGLFPEGSHPPIAYPAAPVTGGDPGPLLAFLTGPEAQAVFAEEGFGPPER